MANAPDDSTRRDFASYYEGAKGRPPRPTLVQAAAAFARPGFAVDLGCGDGRDSVELLRRGWRVLAIDASEEGIGRLGRRDDLPDNAALEARVQRIEAADWPPADLVNASFVLPLLGPEAFPRVWARIGARLAPGGRFAGQLFGPRDGWADRAGLAIHDRSAVEQLLSGYRVERLDEVESDEPTARGKPKHWHVFHLVLAMPQSAAQVAAGSIG
ncbi:MAG: class I SAM-dependent methyltransferase [Alphaproteobacteria bacterium]|nr:class I SAM-dependent methyltransferase [Alphaproteobacteria bacterium]